MEQVQVDQHIQFLQLNNQVDKEQILYLIQLLLQEVEQEYTN